MSSYDGRGRGRGQGYQDRGRGGAGRGDGRGVGPRGGGSSRGGGGGPPSRGGGDYRGRGGRGGRGGFNRTDLPDVRGLAEQMSALAIAKQKPKGKEGREIVLIANHYRINFDDITCYHYDIEISLRRNDGKGVISMTATERNGIERKLRAEAKMDNVRIVDNMANNWPEVFKKVLYAFDGQKNLYCGKKLAIGNGGHKRQVTIQLDGFQQQTFEVQIQFTNEVVMSTINDYLTGTLRNARTEQFREALQVLDIVLRYVPSQRMVPVFRNLYSRKDRQEVADNAQIGFGHYQSVQLTESGLTLNMDRTATLFRSDGTLKQFVERALDADDLKRTSFTVEVIGRLNRKIKGLKIFTNHILNQKRRYFIESMSARRPNEAIFSVTDDSGNTSETNVGQYFADKYKVRLELQNVPLIIVRGGTVDNPRYLPLELCHVYADQPVPKRLITPAMTREIVSASNSQNPSQRFGLIQESVQEVNQESNPLMESFGISLNLKPMKLTGRVLPPPQVTGTQNRLKLGQKVQKYMFFNFSQEVNPNWRQYYNDFFRELISAGAPMGVAISQYNAQATQPPPNLISVPCKGMETIENAFKNAVKNQCQIIFFCIPKTHIKSDEIYYGIKYFGDIVYGIPTQCILDVNFMNPPRGYFGNIMLKINAKLDGQNQVLSQPMRPNAFTKSDQTMIVGVDVTHPGTNPLANERVVSSIAASVASFDNEFSKYMATIAGQPMNTEIIANYDEMFVKQLRFYCETNKKFPQSIIVYRDGVSEGQFAQVLDNEIPLIEKAFRKLGAKQMPKITVFVVQKRHHTRFMPFERTFNDRNGKEIFNIPAGTVVDHTITNPTNPSEFHLCSHQGLLGTSRHAKYVCLRDDHNFSEDNKQKLSFYLCHTYCRCTKSISIPTPVMYAHLAAFRSKQHIAAQNIEFERRVRDESAPDKAAREQRNITALNQKIIVNPKLVSLPYYS